MRIGVEEGKGHSAFISVIRLIGVPLWPFFNAKPERRNAKHVYFCDTIQQPLWFKTGFHWPGKALPSAGFALALE